MCLGNTLIFYTVCRVGTVLYNVSLFNMTSVSLLLSSVHYCHQEVVFCSLCLKKGFPIFQL